MMGGLEAIANIGGRVAIALASPQLDWDLHPAEPYACASYEEGVCWTVTRRNGRVVASALAEAGAAIVAELDQNDAMTLAALCTAEGA
jgi:hypothetical protein